MLLWSVVRDLGVTGRKRPQYLAVQLANEAIAGDAVQVVQSGDNPTWNQPAINFYQRLGATVMPEWRICRLTDQGIAQLSK